jgi:hypothetical protein
MKTRLVIKLSPIYVQGWNMANTLPADDFGDLDSAGVTALNPYPADPERARWNKGFREARETCVC